MAKDITSAPRLSCLPAVPVPIAASVPPKTKGVLEDGADFPQHYDIFRAPQKLYLLGTLRSLKASTIMEVAPATSVRFT